jgi:N-formylglutamate amidohydrolase
MGPPVVAFHIRRGELPVFATAIHAGHDVRDDLRGFLALDDATRLREEDPFTDRLTSLGGGTAVVHRSRFEVDLNRPRDRAVYRTPDDAWGLEVWRHELPDAQVEASLTLYDDFYRALAEELDELAAHQRFVVLDLHSYNHRRAGAAAAPDPVEENPELNVGTGSLDRGRWGSLVDRFTASLAAQEVAGHRLDVRENVRFKGGHLSSWINERYAGTGCALAIECKKVFMDEWTGELDADHLGQLHAALAATVPALVDELRSA